MSKVRRGIALARGSGTRLVRLTANISRELLPVYDELMIYCSLSVLLMTDIREDLVISTSRDLPLSGAMRSDESAYGLTLSYAVQDEPRGFAEAFLTGRDFLDGHASALMRGDKLFYEHAFADILDGERPQRRGVTVLRYPVRDASRFGVVENDADGRALSIEQNPARPRSKNAVTGLYFYNELVSDLEADLCPSARGELEISDLIRSYRVHGELHVCQLGQAFAWLDAGTFDSLIDAASYVATLQRRQGRRTACPEEIAYRRSLMNEARALAAAERVGKSDYGSYSREVLATEVLL
jgi:glucose-1-phosphate thymidylyltransferase